MKSRLTCSVLRNLVQDQTIKKIFLPLAMATSMSKLLLSQKALNNWFYHSLPMGYAKRLIAEFWFLTSPVQSVVAPITVGETTL